VLSQNPQKNHHVSYDKKMFEFLEASIDLILSQSIYANFKIGFGAAVLKAIR
jgi:hypothetical protein